MQLSFTSFPEAMFFIVFLFAIGLLLYTFGWHILHDMNANLEVEQPEPSKITAKQVTHYFTDKGYVVCNITPVKNSNKWLAFLVKNGDYQVATVFTNGESIEGHLDSLE